MVKKDDLATYEGEVYEVFQIQKHSDMIVLKKRGQRGNIVYVWRWKCKEYEGETT